MCFYFTGVAQLVRVAVSKTAGWGFESLHPCKIRTNVMDKIKLYFKESYNELVHKVTWPSWSSLQSNTILVIVASIIFALFILVMDAISKFGTNMVYGL